MQVSHVNDHVTHAVIGGGDTIEFGISSSAEFFNILSSTLYKDQILAVVREGLCNAWDAHIEAGCTHLPIQVTLNEEVFVIKDVGKGIHKDDIGPIYGVYGNSTKKNDGKQTGGFGLGCKSPFAYTDHFEVISCHDGVKTIYNMSKSSAKAQGKPGIIPIASFPTEETGLQVTIRTKNHTDRYRFMQLIKRIAFNGGMNVVLNGEKLPVIEFDVNKNNYLITRVPDLLDTPTRIMVRYGNVIYPVDCNAEIKDLYLRVMEHLDTLGDRQQGHNYDIIFQAPPHSIAVTPSRESLSMQEHTVTTLNTLFASFMKIVDAGFTVVCQEKAKEFIDASIVEGNLTRLLTHDDVRLPGVTPGYRPQYISDLETMAARLLSRKYPDGLEFRKWDLRRRLEGLMKSGALDRGLVQTYLRDLDMVKEEPVRDTWRDSKHEGSAWLSRRVLSPLLVKLQAAKLDVHALSVYDPTDLAHSSKNPPRGTDLVPALRAKPRHHFNCLPYLRNIVVLSCARMGFTDRVYHKHPVFKERGSYAGFLFYHVGMKKADKEAARAFWKDSGMVVVDIIDIQPWEMRDREARTVVPRKPAKVGLACLSGIRDKKYNQLNTRLWRNEDVPRIAKPEFVIQLPLNKNSAIDCIGDLDRETSKAAWKLFAEKGGVAPTSVILDQYVKKGVPAFDTYLQAKVEDAMRNRPSIQQYLAFSLQRVIAKFGLSGDLKGVTTAIYETKALRDQFGLANDLSGEDVLYLKIFLHFVQRNIGRYNKISWAWDLQTEVEQIPLDPANDTLQKKLKSNSLLSILDADKLGTLLDSTKTTQAEKDKIIKVILSIIE